MSVPRRPALPFRGRHKYASTRGRDLLRCCRRNLSVGLDSAYRMLQRTRHSTCSPLCAPLVAIMHACPPCDAINRSSSLMTGSSISMIHDGCSSPIAPVPPFLDHHIERLPHRRRLFKCILEETRSCWSSLASPVRTRLRCSSSPGWGSWSGIMEVVTGLRLGRQGMPCDGSAKSSGPFYDTPDRLEPLQFNPYNATPYPTAELWSSGAPSSPRLEPFLLSLKSVGGGVSEGSGYAKQPTANIDISGQGFRCL